MNKEKKIILATHGELAKGFLSALQIIVGETDVVQTICAYLTPEFDLQKEIEDIMSTHDFEKSELIVCTDMMGGSVNNGFVKVMADYQFHLLTNINLACLVELILSPEEISYEMIDNKVKDGLFTVTYVNSIVNDYDDDIENAI